MNKIFTLLFTTLIVSISGNAQDILNGGFEDNPFVSDLINPEPGLLNAGTMPGFYCLSEEPSVDMITSSDFGAPSQEGSWHLGVSGGGLEVFSLEFDPPLTFGTEYQISYFEKAYTGFTPIPFIFAVSGAEDSYGDTVFVATTIGEGSGWTAREFTFTPDGNATHLVVAVDGGTIENRCYIDHIFFGDATNTTEFIEDDFAMYPNPVSDEMNVVNIAANIDEIVIYNVTGQIVKNYRIGSITETKLNLADLTSGSYIVELKNSEGSYIGRKTFQKN